MTSKKTRILAILAGFLLTAGTAAAGDFWIGAHGGLSIPNLRGSQTDIFTRGFSSRQGPFFGIFVEKSLIPRLSLVAELNYTSQGGNKNGLQLITSVPPGFPTDIYLYADFKNENILDYVELPVMARVYFGGKVRFFANAGPYVGYLVRAKAVTSGSSYIYLDEAGTIPAADFPVSFDATTDVKDSLKKWNFGLTGGAGLRFAAGPGDLILEAHFQLGLATIQKDIATSGKSQVGAVVISLGYGFSTSR